MTLKVTAQQMFVFSVRSYNSHYTYVPNIWPYLIVEEIDISKIKDDDDDDTYVPREPRMEPSIGAVNTGYDLFDKQPEINP